ncbi:hypothetical protein N579_09505 [Corynebacterium pseudodiphtheriticum 090104]|nr:hypothetical protein N579_09505 [Corynebacterium pseudodiphtheriticum 090104]
MESANALSFYDAAKWVYQRRGKLSGAAETESWWLFAPASPEPGKGPIMINRKTNELEQFGSLPKEWKPRLEAFKKRRAHPTLHSRRVLW